MFRKLISCALLAVLCLAAKAKSPEGITLVKGHKSQAVILLEGDLATSQRAATLLNKFLLRISGDSLGIVQNPAQKGGRGRKGTVVIGRHTDRAKYDGFSIESHDGQLIIGSASGKGAVYGVAELLEHWLGVDYLAYEYYTLTQSPDVILPQIDTALSPAFRFRQTQGYGLKDPDYNDWMRVAQHVEIFAGDLWVHTFDKLLPSEKYGEAHPEYYSFINGERRPGKHSQWCLTNPEVFEAACRAIDSVFRANPGKTLLSVSQNDGNFTNCQCPECKALEEYEGSPSGPLIHFLNHLAERFPDKEFSTLAYLFTMQPPKHVKPLPNVNIMLCDIDAKREAALTDNPSGRDFVRAIEGWSRISDNIFVWDYGINFDNIVSPFPNFHIIQPNAQLFRDHHASMIFEQIHGGRGCDLSELRTYLMSKLMWNPDIDIDRTMRHFMEKYYGAASDYIYQYIKLMEGALLASGKELWIYDSPVTHKDRMLNPQLRRRYNTLFDNAEAAVADDPERLAHVELSRLSLRYSDLEIQRATGSIDPKVTPSKVREFRELCTSFEVPTLNERANSPQEYCDIYISRYLPSAIPNKARGARISFGIAPTGRYAAGAEKALTDGVYGGTTFVESWVGWEGIDGDFTLDFGESIDINNIDMDLLHQPNAWILMPRRVHYLLSEDGENFTEVGSVGFPEDRDMSIKFYKAPLSFTKAAKARFLRVKVDSQGLCSPWHFGVGYPVWFFIDEIVVN